jgi:hypothetical protein
MKEFPPEHSFSQETGKLRAMAVASFVVAALAFSLFVYIVFEGVTK